MFGVLNLSCEVFNRMFSDPYVVFGWNEWNGKEWNGMKFEL